MSAFFSPLINKHYLWMCSKCPGKPPAEYRLIPMMASCWLIPIGLFIFAWTSYPRIHWFGPAIGGWPVGFGFIYLYNSANNYLGKSFSPTLSCMRYILTHNQLILINIRQLLHSLRKPSFDLCGVPALFCSQSRCTTVLITSGPVLSLPLLVWPAALSPSSSGSRVLLSGSTLATPSVTTTRWRRNLLARSRFNRF